MERLLTARARRALDLAAHEAAAQGHDQVTGDHLLAGLMRLDEGVAVLTLNSLGAVPAPGINADLGRLTELARQEAAELGHRYVGTEHLLLGLLRENEAAVPGVGLQQARAQVIRVLRGDGL
ncbi:Clp protease N-terminal domain-containing protein [Nonomuraea monospora]|uniref:Clp protease N-terminal domain-containing protein n=1 Tax=Nonomuraea monospora TaxID=568818 RepID=UPI0031D67136